MIKKDEFPNKQRGTNEEGQVLGFGVQASDFSFSNLELWISVLFVFVSDFDIRTSNFCSHSIFREEL